MLGQPRLCWANLLGCGERNRRPRDNKALNRSDISRRGRLIPWMVGFANFTIHSTHKFKPLLVARLTRALSDPSMQMPKRFTILGMLSVTACIAFATALVVRSMRPAYEIRFHNDTNFEITDLNLFVYPLLTNGTGVWDELKQTAVSPGQCVTFRHDIENAQLDFGYHITDRQLKYTNLDLAGRTETQLRTTPSGEWSGAGNH